MIHCGAICNLRVEDPAAEGWERLPLMAAGEAWFCPGHADGRKRAPESMPAIPANHEPFPRGHWLHGYDDVVAEGQLEFDLDAIGA